MAYRWLNREPAASTQHGQWAARLQAPEVPRFRRSEHCIGTADDSTRHPTRCSESDLGAKQRCCLETPGVEQLINQLRWRARRRIDRTSRISVPLVIE